MQDLGGKYSGFDHDAYGFSYIEILVALSVLALCLAPIVASFQTAMTCLAEEERHVIDQMALQSKLEEVLATSFSELSGAAGGMTTPTAYSDTLPHETVDGRFLTRHVYLALYDGNGDGIPETDLLFVRVEIENTAHRFETLINKN